MGTRKRGAFTIIELLIVVIVIGILAAAGLAKYQNFAESSRRKTCMSQLKEIDTGLAVWETNNTSFGNNAKCGWGYTPRTGRLTSSWNTVQSVGSYGAGSVGNSNILFAGSTGTIPACNDASGVTVVGAPSQFVNMGTTAASPNAGPLSTVIRDSNVWVCPSAVSRYYSGEIQNVADDYLDASGLGVTSSHTYSNSTVLGLGGRYFHVVTGAAQTSGSAITNGGFPDGWINGSVGSGYVSGSTNYASPCPQAPFKIALCGCYGTYGPNSSNAGQTGTSVFQNGGPCGPDGSTLNRHSARW